MAKYYFKVFCQMSDRTNAMFAVMLECRSECDADHYDATLEDRIRNLLFRNAPEVSVCEYVERSSEAEYYNDLKHTVKTYDFT